MLFPRTQRNRLPARLRIVFLIGTWLELGMVGAQEHAPSIPHPPRRLWQMQKSCEMDKKVTEY